MSVALKAVAWAWRFTQTAKRLTGFQGTRKSQLPGPLEPGTLQLPRVQSTGKSFYCLDEKSSCWSLFVSYYINLKFFTGFRKLCGLQSVKVSDW